jgi:SNF2 family DNA or RNA helicase
MKEWREPVLWEHQRQAYEYAKDLPEYAFLFEPGVGKTLTTIKVLRYKYAQAERVLRTLVVAPLITLENWRNEWLKYSKIPRDCLCVLAGNTKDRIALLEKFRKRNNENFIAITNYEGLTASKDFLSAVMEWEPEAIVIDESQRIKNGQSKRARTIINIADRTAFRYLLTGTPILNTPMDIFAQWRALDRGKSFGTNFFTFRAKYFYDKNCNMPKHCHFPNWQIRADSYAEINSIIYKKAMRAIKSECLDLPPFVTQQVFVELSAQQKKMYKEMEANFITSINDNLVTAEIALTKLMRLLQIISGFVKDEYGNITDLKDNPRLEALDELLDDLTPNHKVIIWAVFKENYGHIRNLLSKKNIPFVEAHGEIGTNQKFDSVYKFNTDDNVRVFLGHPGSLGIGINLVASDVSIYFNRTHNLEHDVQSEARNYRGGSEIHKCITRIDIITKGTLDEVILKNLQDKTNNAEKILSSIKEYLQSGSEAVD